VPARYKILGGNAGRSDGTSYHRVILREASRVSGIPAGFDDVAALTAGRGREVRGITGAGDRRVMRQSPTSRWRA
jgi:hypothetical protein